MPKLSSYLYLFGFAFSTAHEHIQSENIVHLEFLVLDFLLEGLLVEDNLVAVNQVLLEIVGKDTFQRLNFIGVAHFLDGLSNLVVEVTWFDQSQCSLGSFIGGKDNIGFLASDGSLSIRLHNDGVGSKSSKSVDMGTEFDFDEVTFLDGGGLFGHGRVVSAHLIDRNTSGEGDSLEDLLLVEDLVELLDEGGVAEEAQVEDLGAD